MIHNVISMSGGKDSTAMALLAIERGAENLHLVFADTGHEHRQTYQYVDYLEHRLGVKIERVKADFTRVIAGKRAYIEKHWLNDLTKDEPGYWDWDGDDDDQPETYPGPPSDESRPCEITFPGGTLEWIPPKKGMSIHDASERVERALALLYPTGIPFLDLCLWKGRFPSTKARFCSTELKHVPLNDYCRQVANGAQAVISWQGVRRQESPARAGLAERDVELGVWEPEPRGFLIYRPILDWTIEDVFAMHKRHGVEPNPLYKQGMGRVGCMPCIHASKDELRNIAMRFPEEIERVAEWERLVSQAAKRGVSTFGALAIGKENVTLEEYGIANVIDWARTSRGGKQRDLIHMIEEQDVPICSSQYGLCE